MQENLKETIVNSEPVACPFCGQGIVMAKIFITYTFLSEHPIYTDGVDMEGDTLGQMFGDLANEPTMKYGKFHCTNCGKEWLNSNYSLVKDENGINHFVKVEKSRKKL